MQRVQRKLYLKLKTLCEPATRAEEVHCESKM